jgi:hypothetical protein
MTKNEALILALKHLSLYAFIYFETHQSEDEELLSVIMACQEAVDQPEATTH